MHKPNTPKRHRLQLYSEFLCNSLCVSIYLFLVKFCEPAVFKNDLTVNDNSIDLTAVCGIYKSGGQVIAGAELGTVKVKNGNISLFACFYRADVGYAQSLCAVNSRKVQHLFAVHTVGQPVAPLWSRAAKFMSENRFRSLFDA